MNHTTKSTLELAQAEIAIALKHMDVEPELAYQHIARAMKELKEAEYSVWHKFHCSGVPYKVKVKA
jgi:hypothetical protein